MNARAVLGLVVCVALSFIFPALGFASSLLLLGAGFYLYRRNRDTQVKAIALAAMVTGGLVLTILSVIVLTGYGAQGKPVFSEGVPAERFILPEVTPTP